MSKTALWDAINHYCVACGGSPSTRIYGNVERQRAVVAVERVICTLETAARNAALDNHESEGVRLTRCSNCGCPMSVHAGDDAERRGCSECECQQFVAPNRVGEPGLRDPDHQCDMYSPGKPTNGGCAGDGHYLCSKCVLHEEASHG